MPIRNAIGIVQNTANVPHGLPISALTTTSARTARTMTQIRRTPTPAIVPAIGPISARAISPSERPSRRVDRNRTVMYWTNQWTGAGNRREMMAVQHISIGRDVIEAVVMAVGGRWPRTIDAKRLV